jgi:hypothetical protein
MLVVFYLLIGVIILDSIAKFPDKSIVYLHDWLKWIPKDQDPDPDPDRWALDADPDLAK